jgi:hypothetical protein
MNELAERMRAAHVVDDWTGVSFEARAKALWNLLELVDSLPIHGEAPLPSQTPSLPEKFNAVHEALEGIKMPHAIGGAFALAYHAEPRSTVDIDVNVFAPTDRWPEIDLALQPLGVDVAIDMAALDREGEAQPLPFGESTLPIVSAEHILVRKVILDRAKDWPDIERILDMNHDLDLSEVETWLHRMVGANDPRIEKLGRVRAGLTRSAH